MRVAIVHYHLRGGGVTRVISNAAALLRERGVEVCILSGEEPSERSGNVHTLARVVQGLGYSDDPGGRDAGAALAQAMRDAATAALGGAPDLWHFHNPTLGKNALLCRSIHALALRGERLVLHIHDFAEDGRPGNYRRLKPLLEENPGIVYPRGERVGYATINERDQRVLLDAGASLVEVLPNSAAILDQIDEPNTADDKVAKSRACQKTLVLAPVRGIRRKNVGELGLLALLEEDHVEYVTSLAVRSGESVHTHRRWEKFFGEHNIPVRLGVGEEESCVVLANKARNFVTTSVLEGFGLSILEAALFRKALAGRDLPEVTSLARKAGLIPHGMYSHLWIPAVWVDESLWRQKMETCLRRTWATYGREPTEEDIQKAIRMTSHESGAIDFGALDEPLQERVLERITRDRSCSDVVREINPALRLEGGWTESGGLADFSPARCGDRLLNLYESLLAYEHNDHPKLHALDHTRILDFFLAPERFRLLLAA